MAVTPPFLRVVVIHYGEPPMTLRCLAHVLESDWPSDRIEVVVVDNGGGEPIAPFVKPAASPVRVLSGRGNLGFAGGCNLALRNLTGVDLVAIVNNDVSVDTDWLAPLWETLDGDPTLGAAAPRIMLDDHFRLLHVTVPTVRAGRFDHRELGIRVHDARVDGAIVSSRVRFPSGTWGPEWDSTGSETRWTAGEAELLVPVDRDAIEHCELLLSARGPVMAEFRSGDLATRVEVGAEPAWCRVGLSGERFEAFHNAGTSLDAYGYGHDRGFLERDGAPWMEPCDVFAWCGAAVMLRADYLRDVGLFDERLFLYYEDVELSWRGHEHGWRYRYVPSSTVHHLHSSSTSRRPVRTLSINERNRLLVLARHGAPKRTAHAALRLAAVTGSYALRDIVDPLLSRRPVTLAHTSARVRALGGFVAGAPRAIIARGRDSRGPRH